VAFESKSGDALAVYENNENTNATELQFRTFTAGAWSAGTNFGSFGNHETDPAQLPPVLGPAAVAGQRRRQDPALRPLDRQQLCSADSTGEQYQHDRRGAVQLLLGPLRPGNGDDHDDVH